MLANQARRFGETLVDRHVLSRDDLEHAIDEAERTAASRCPSVLLRLGLVGSKDLTAALAEQLGVRVHRLPRDADPPGRADAVPAERRAQVRSRCRSTSRTTSSSSRSRSRPTTTRSPRSAPRPATRSSPRSPTAPSSLRAIDMIYGAATATARPSRAGVAVERRRRGRSSDELHINELLELVIQWRRFRPPPHRRARRRSSACTASCARSPTCRCSTARRSARWCTRSSRRSSGRSSRTSSSSTRRTRCPGKGRFRVNVFLQRDSVGCVMRAIPYEIVDFDTLGVAARGEDVGVPAARSRARHRPDRFGQVDDARVARSTS